MHKGHIVQLVAAAFLAASALPGFGQTTGESWDMVHIGVSQLGRVAQLYGERLGDDLGVQVNFWFRNARYSTAAEFLQSEEGKIVNDAEIVFVGMAPVAGRFEGYCLDTVTDQPYNQTPVELREDIDAFLAELVRHADPSKTIIRIVLHRRHPGWKAMWVERGTVEDCAAGWMERNAQWKEAAAAYGVPVIDLTAEWVGADGLGDAPQGYLMPGLTANITAEGAEAAAALVRAAGYAPLAE